MKIKTVLLLFYLTCFSLCAQEITGLWEIKKVTIGNKVMTPVAKWTLFSESNTYFSGNGWLQHSEGTFTIRQNRIKLYEKNGIADPFGSFELLQTGPETMIWKRVEEGQNVLVTFIKKEQKPKSLSDQITGLWQLAPNTAENSSYLHLRWDHVMVVCDNHQSKTYGYWQVNAHRPVLTLIQEGVPFEKWEINALNDSTLTLKGNSTSNQNEVLTYSRINKFPD